MMSLWTRIFGGAKPSLQPRAAVQSAGSGVIIDTPQKLEEIMRAGAMTASGASVTAANAMKVAAVYACVRLRSGVVANMPLHIKRRIDERSREDATDHPCWKLMRRKPNRWQTPSQFKRMMTAHQMLRGNGYAMIVWSRGLPIELVPLHPDRVECGQNDDLTLSYVYTRRDGRRVEIAQRDMFHLVGMSLNGVTGVSVIAYARETIGLSIAMEAHGSKVFKNGARPSTVLKHPAKISKEGQAFLQASLDEYRAGGENEGKVLILEEGMDVAPLSMTAEDTQWIESRKLSRTDIAMFFGVPPHMIGDTEKSTSWGSGIDSQTQGFVTFSAEDDLTTWEETINRDLLVAPGDLDVYARFNRAALVRGDLKARWESYVKALQWGVFSPNEVRALEDLNPRDGGDIFYQPPNTAGKNDTQEGVGDEPQNPA